MTSCETQKPAEEIKSETSEEEEGSETTLDVDNETLASVGFLTAVSIEDLKLSFRSNDADQIENCLSNSIKNLGNALETLKARKPGPKKNIDKKKEKKPKITMDDVVQKTPSVKVDSGDVAAKKHETIELKSIDDFDYGLLK